MGTRPRRHPEAAYRAIANEGGLVVLPRRSEVKVLNPVGTLVYGLLDGQHTVDEIAQAVVAEFEIDPQQAERDVMAFLGELESHGMLAAEQATEASS